MFLFVGDMSEKYTSKQVPDHILKSRLGTTMRMKRISLKDTKDALGHSSLSVTDLYIKLAIQQVVEKTKHIENDL